MAVQDMLQSISDRVGNIASVNTVFGEPRVMDHKAIIPVAVVAGGFGAGGGEGKRPMPEQDGKQEEGSGGGGGGWFALRPLAFLEISDGPTKLIPVLDLTKIILASMGILGAGFWMIAKSRAKQRRLHGCG